MESAMVAWVNSCASTCAIDAKINSFADLANGVALSNLAAHFLDCGRLDKDGLARHLSMPPHSPDHILLGEVMLQGVGGPQKNEAVGAIMTLEPDVQAVIAQLLQTQMSGLDDITLTRQTSPPARRNSADFLRRLSIGQHDPKLSANSGLPAGLGDDSHLREDLKKLHSELEASEMHIATWKNGQTRAAKQLRELRGNLCDEEDMAHESEKKLLEFEDECRQTDSKLQHLREELRQERIGDVEDDRIGALRRQIEEQVRDCRSLRGKQDDLADHLDHAKLGAEKQEKQNWRRTALLSKITRLEEAHKEKEKQLITAKGLQFKEERAEGGIKYQMYEATEELSFAEERVSEMRAVAIGAEMDLEFAQSRLHFCDSELQVFKRGDIDQLNEELTMRANIAAQLEQTCGDAHTRYLRQEAEVPLLEEAIKRVNDDLAELNQKQDANNIADRGAGGEKDHATKVRTELTDVRAIVSQEEDQVRQLHRECDEAAARRVAAHEEANVALAKYDKEAAARLKGRGHLRGMLLPKADQVLAATPIGASAAATETPPTKSRASAKPRELGESAMKSSAITPSGPMVTKLREQLNLRERELVWRESQAGEAEGLHQREARLIAGAIHELGIKYAKVLSECEAEMAAEQDLQDEAEEEALEQARKNKGMPSAPSSTGSGSLVLGLLAKAKSAIKAKSSLRSKT